MNTKTLIGALITVALAVSGTALFPATGAYAHCDTLSGPVITDAKGALESKDVTPVLKWIKPEDEPEIRALFDHTVEARQQGAEVQELVDMHFFETLVRVHRAGEGAPYTGLKPADTPLEPGIEAAEKALESESDDALLQALVEGLTSSVHERFDRVAETKKHKDDSVEAGRAYVAAYVDYIHYVEALHAIFSGTGAHGHGQSAEQTEHGYAEAEHQHTESAPAESGAAHHH
ncbi:MAG: hypothetical protein KA184_19250 [Candidatus Hydrogenedentes bacterium]|nr:hypothetical protein [Candidatus Hydrogenedentota bacterium]